MPPAISNDPLPAPTRAVRPDSAQKAAKSGPPFKLFIAAAVMFMLLSMILMGVGLHYGVETAKEYGYDTELAKKYPTLAAFVVGIKNSKFAEDVVIDNENGCVTYKDKRTGRKFRVREIGGQISHEVVTENKDVGSDLIDETPKPKQKLKKKPTEKDILDNKF